MEPQTPQKSSPASIRRLVERREELRMQQVVKRLDIENAVARLSAEEESTLNAIVRVNSSVEAICQELNEKSQQLNNIPQPKAISELGFLYFQKREVQRVIRAVQGGLTRGGRVCGGSASPECNPQKQQRRAIYDRVGGLENQFSIHFPATFGDQKPGNCVTRAIDRGKFVG